MRYYISDLHFFHESMNERMDKRGFASVEAMNQYMIEKWNQKVRKNDEVIILGDLSIGSAKKTNEILRELNGTLYLIEGNHDKFVSQTDFDKSRFVWIRPYAEVKDNKRKVVLSHYPVFCYNGQYKGDESKQTYMLYGHVHNTFDEYLVDSFIKKTRECKREVHGREGEIEIPCNMINCFCMYSDYEPLSLDEWIALDERRRAKITGPFS